MRIIKRGYGYVYNVTCPRCGSELEAEEGEIEIRPHYNDACFTCPACQGTPCRVSISKVTKYIKYEQDK